MLSIMKEDCTCKVKLSRLVVRDQCWSFGIGAVAGAT